MEKLKIGIIGLNQESQWYIRTIQQMVPEMELIAASSRSLEELELVESKFGIKQNYVDFRDMLGLHELDTVIVASDPIHRVRQSIEALDKGLHVIVSMPVAHNVSDCDNLIKKAERYPNQLVMAGLYHRYTSHAIQARKQIEVGGIGNIMSIQLSTRRAISQKQKETFSKISSGSIFMDVSLPDLDLIRFLGQAEIAQVFALSINEQIQKNKGLPAERFALATGKMNNGIIWNLQVETKLGSDYASSVSIHGSKAKIWYDSNMLNLQIDSDEGHSRTIKPNYQDIYQAALRQQFTQFANAIHTSSKSPVPLSEARAVTQAAVALSKSIALNEIVELN